MRFRILALMADFGDFNLVDGCACNFRLGKSTWDSVRVNEVCTCARARLDEVRGAGCAE
jgi:hypothetical protein